MISTRHGYVAWLPWGFVDDAYTPGLQLPINQTSARGNGSSMYCNRVMPAAWAMTRGPAGTIELADQSGTRWSVDPSVGAPSAAFKYEALRQLTGNAGVCVDGPVRDLAWLGASALTGAPVQGALLNFTGPTAFTKMPPTAVVQQLDTIPYVGESGGPVLPYPVPAPYENTLWRNTKPHSLHLYDGYAMFLQGGDVLQGTGSILQAHWWGAQNNDLQISPNLLQGLYLNAGALVDQWASVAGPAGSNTNIPVAQIQGLMLRNAVKLSANAYDLQSLRLMPNPTDPTGGQAPAYVVVATSGGSVQVVRPGAGIGVAPSDYGAPVAESADFGYGGMALAVVDDPNNSNQSLIYFGVTLSHASAASYNNIPQAADDVTGAIVVLPFDWTSHSLGQGTLYVLDGSGPLTPKAFGVCGLAVGDALGSVPGAELVATTMDGQMFVYQRQNNGALAALSCQLRVDGALGAFNSILFDDSDQDGKMETWVAGSTGLRRFEER